MRRREATFENAVSFAQDLIRIPSLPGREEDVAARVHEEMSALGMRDARLDAAGNVMGVVPGSDSGPSVMLSCHLDIVSVGDESEWERPPFAGLVEGGYLHGRGAMDIKGPLAIQTYAAAALAGRVAGDVIVAHTVFEERGGLGMKHLVESGEVAPRAVVIGEATHGDVCVGHRGRGEVEVILGGRAGHASAPGRARNALDLLPVVLEAVERLDAAQPADELLGRASLVATDVSAEPRSRNVIPDRVVVVLDWRVVPGQTHESLVSSLEEAIRAVAPDLPEGLTISVALAQEEQVTYTGVARTRDLFTPGFAMDPADPLVRAAAAAVGRRDGDGPARVRPWTFATDGGWTCGVHGIPTIGFAPGEERYAHTNRERLDLSEARWAFERYPGLVVALQDELAARS